MAELTTLARPYAAAVFKVAKEEDALEPWAQALALFTGSLEDPRVWQLVTSPVHSHRAKARSFVKLFDVDLSESMKRFIHVLAENRRLELIPQIRAEFEVRLAEAKRSLDVEITSSIELSTAELAAFEKALLSRFDRQIKVTTLVDPSILGGALIRAGDTVMDGTVRGRLEKLRTTLQRN